MEIRDPLHGTIELSPSAVEVIDSLQYQRLRAIKQLGFSEFSFPGATHNRYLHSIGVQHLAGKAFDAIFKSFKFSTEQKRKSLKDCLQLGALLHDIGHGPLSHATEEVMPELKELKIEAYSQIRKDIPLPKRASNLNRQADHEDYTIKFVTDSALTKIISKNFECTPFHVACLVDKTLKSPDDFFIEQGLDFRPILSQLVSSEMDCDRMDYLERDAYFCGTNYGKIELGWLLGNLTYNEVDGKLFLALNRRALYSFDDFLLARHHMHLMVYFHHKSIIFEEFLIRYLQSKDCTFRLPADINDYVQCTDYALYEHLAHSDNKWAKRITERNMFKVLFELHSTETTHRADEMKTALEKEGFETILVSSTARVSKYHASGAEEKAFPIYVVDQYDRLAKPYPIEQTTEIFQKYENIRCIDRIYVEPSQYAKAEKLITSKKL